MRSYVLALLIFYAAFPAKAQFTNDSANQAVIRKRCKPVYLVLEPRARDQDPTPLFKDIRVMDYRRDTSRVGIVASNLYSQFQLVFKNSTAAALAEHFNTGYTGPNGPNSMLVVVKNCWVGNQADTMPDHPSAPSTNDPAKAWNLALRLEAYLKQPDGYIPLTYLDTVTTEGGISGARMTQKQLPILISIFMNKVIEADPERAIARKRVVSWQQVDSFCRSQYRFPMDTARTLVKGVYNNIEEFRNNKPSVTSFEVGKDKMGNLELRVAEADGRYIFTRSVWGFCDGKQAFVMMDGNVFPVMNVYHQFYVLGSKEFSRDKIWVPDLSGPMVNGVLVPDVRQIETPLKRKLRIYRLDMDSGEVTF